MGYINFDKNQLVNLSYSLGKEMLKTSRSGAYANTTIINCNTTKHHGLLVVPQKNFDDKQHVLLSSFDETVIQHHKSFNLGIHKFPNGVYHPGGHKYVQDFNSEPIPTVIYRVGGVLLKKETLFTSKKERYMIRYTLLDAHSQTWLQFRPFLAFREVNALTRENSDANTHYETIENGISMKLYEGYTPIYMQFSKKAEYHHQPNWYKNIEYFKDQEYGVEYQEDLLVPGYFEVPIKKGESLLFIAGLEQTNPKGLKGIFTKEINNRTPRDNFENCLINSGQQFLVRKGNTLRIVSGFPSEKGNCLHVPISAPGLFLTQNLFEDFECLFDTMIENCSELHRLLYPEQNEGMIKMTTGLMFVWSIQQYALKIKDNAYIWKKYGKTIRLLVENIINQKIPHVFMDENGLLEINTHDYPATWMNAMAYGKPVTPRNGKAVEINAFWYNALNFLIQILPKKNNVTFKAKLSSLSDKLKAGFIQQFWNEKKGYLADHIHANYIDWTVRPNMIFAASMPYSMLEDDKKLQVLQTVKTHLLTRKGIRTLSPQNENYKGEYVGNINERALAYHQGSVIPWLFTHFADAYLQLYGKQGMSLVHEIYQSFEDEMARKGIGSISELYNGNPPNRGRGAISFSSNVAELLRLHEIMEKKEL